jgi:agmatine deiminase
MTDRPDAGTSRTRISDPDRSNVRLPAEWEPQAFVQFTFPHRNSDWAYMYDEVVKCFVDVIKAAARFEPVLVVCHSREEVSAYFTEETLFPVTYAVISSDDTWARDHGAITVMNGDEPVLYDFVFNGWGGKFNASSDNLITRQLVEKGVIKSSLESFEFVLEGGSIESDGMGTLLTTSECLLSPGRNPGLDKDQITHFLEEVFGIKKVLWLDHGYLEGDDTDSHIDTLARLCSPSKIAYVKCTSADDEHYEALQKMEEQVKRFTNASGEKYELISLPWPDACFDSEGMRLPSTYANFLILNNAVLVPVYGVPQDKEALLIMQGIFPERKVIGINCRALIDQHGSLHCISMQYPAKVLLNNK